MAVQPAPDESDWLALGAPAPDADAISPATTLTTTPEPGWDGLGHAVAGPSGDLATDAGRRLGTAATAAFAGMVGLPRTIAHAADYVAAHVPVIGGQLGAEKALASVPDPLGSSEPMFPSAAEAADIMHRADGTTEYVPQTAMGRIGQGALTAAAGGVLAPETIPAALGGGATGAAVNEVAPGPVGNVIGFLAGAHTINALGNATGRLANAATGAGANATYQAYQRLGLPTNLTGDVTGNPAMQFWQNFAAKMPDAEEDMGAARAQAVGAWNDALDRTGQGLGRAETTQEAGQSLQDNAHQWTQGFQQAQNAAWGQFFQQVPPTTRIQAGNTLQTLGDVANGYGGAQNIAGVMQPSLAARLHGAVQADAGPGNTLPWQTIQRLRSDIGERLGTPQVMDGSENAALKRIYGALSDDMLTGAAMQGAPAVAAFGNANALSAAGHDILDTYIRPVLNAPTPEQAATSAMQGARSGGTRLEALDTHLPGGIADLASATVRQAAGAGSPTAFASNVLGSGGKRPALSPEAANVLYGPQAQNVADLATTGRAMAATERMANHSNTATTEGRGLGRVLTAAEMARTGREMFGMPGAVGGFAAGMMAPFVMGKAAASVALNPLLARLYATDPVMALRRPNALQYLPVTAGQQSGAPDNSLLRFGPAAVGSAATPPTR